MRFKALFVLLIGLAVFSSWAYSQDTKSKKDLVKKELQKFQGKWKAVEITINGASLDMDVVDQTFNIIKGNQFTIKVKEEQIKGTFTIDPTKNPPHLNATYTTPQGKTVHTEGIYDWSNGRRMACVALPNFVRPGEFRKDKGYLYLEWKDSE